MARSRFGELLGLGIVEPRRRLVEAQQLRLRHQRADDLEQLLRAHRQFGRMRLGKGREADEIQQRLGAAAQRALFARAPDSHSIWLGSEWRPRRWPPTITFSIAVMPGKTRADWKVRIRPRPAIFTADRPAKVAAAESHCSGVART